MGFVASFAGGNSTVASRPCMLNTLQSVSLQQSLVRFAILESFSTIANS